MLALDFPLYRLSIRAMLDGTFLYAHHLLPLSLVEKSQDEHGGNVALLTFGNPIIDRLSTGFKQFLKNFQLCICRKNC